MSFPYPETHLNTVESSRIAIFNDWNQKLLFFKLTNCIKSIQWNNFLHFSINYGYKFCNVLFFAIYGRIKNCSFVLYRSINLPYCCSSDHYSIMIKIKSAKNWQIYHSAFWYRLMRVNTGRAVACHRKTWWEVSSGGWWLLVWHE